MTATAYAGWIGQRSVKKGLLFVGVLVAGAAFCLWQWHAGRYTRFPVHQLPRWGVFDGWRVSRTQEYLKTADEAVAAFQRHYGRLPFNSPKREYQFSITLGHVLSGIHPDLNRMNRDRITFWSLPAGEQRDGWGNLLHYHFDHDGDGIVHPGEDAGDIIPGVAPVHRSFVVWSDGPNGRNDGGAGDDLRGW